MAGNQHHRQRDLAAGQFAHQLDAVHARHADIRDHTSCTAGNDGLQEPVRGIEYFDREPEYPQHFAEGVADGILIVDDKDGGHEGMACCRGSQSRNSVAPGAPDCSQSRP
jgi:hypothetical protein